MPQDWLDQVRRYWEESGQSLEGIGRALAELLGRDKPFSPATVHAYVNGHRVTAEMTEAFALLMGTAPPMLGIDDPELLAWCDIGRRLKVQTKDRFREELDALTDLVETLEKHQRRPAR